MCCDLYKLKKSLADDGIIFSFSGTISQAILSSLAETIENKFTGMGIETRTVHSIFAVLVEQLQNLLSYSKESIERSHNVYESIGVLLVGYDRATTRYFVSSGNTIRKDQKEDLSKRLDGLIMMNDEELRMAFKEARKSGRDKHSRGAGLGFLEMARKASAPLKYTINDIDEDSAFFSIHVYI